MPLFDPYDDNDSNRPVTNPIKEWDELNIVNFEEDPNLTVQGVSKREQEYLYVLRCAEKFRAARGPLIGKNQGKRKTHVAYMKKGDHRNISREVTGRMLGLLVRFLHFCSI
jgi:hypothetical protein